MIDSVHLELQLFGSGIELAEFIRNCPKLIGPLSVPLKILYTTMLMTGTVFCIKQIFIIGNEIKCGQGYRDEENKGK